MTAFTEAVVEEAALQWLEALDYVVQHGPEIAPGELAAERADYRQVVLDRRFARRLCYSTPPYQPKQSRTHTAIGWI